MKKRPDKAEYAPYYQNYIDLVKANDIIKTLESQVLAFQAFVTSIPEEKESFAYAPGKWTIKEVIGHIIDTERIMGYRALRIGRGDETPLPGFDENLYVSNAKSSGRTLYDLAHEFSLVRTSNVALFKTFDSTVMDRKGIANNNPLSVRACLYVIAGHELHHINVIKSRYLD